MKRPMKDLALVSLQVLLFATYLIAPPGLPCRMPGLLRFAGIALALAGMVILMLALATLRQHLTPFPSPKQNGQLVTRGVYKYVRHPIYSGIVLAAAGYAFFSEHPVRLAITIALLVLFVYKLRYEETLLANKFPEYNQYRQHTAALFPGIY